MNAIASLISIGRSIALLGLVALSLPAIASAQATINRLFVGKPGLVLGPTSVDGTTWLATSKSGSTVTLLRAKNLAVFNVQSRNGVITPKEISTNGEIFTFQTDTYSFFTYKNGSVQPFVIPGSSGIGSKHVAGAMSDDGSAIIGTLIPPFFGVTRWYYIRNGVAQEIQSFDSNKLRLTHISGDGLTVFGRPGTGTFADQTFYWSQAEGLMTMQNIFGDRTIILGPSTNGRFSVIAQEINDHDYYWMRGVDGGTAQFGLPNARAIAMSLDGSVVTGYSGLKSFRWQVGEDGWQSSTIASINVNGYPVNRPTAISADGAYIALRGITITTTPGSANEGFLYSVEDGVKNLKLLLSQNGASVSNWSGLVVGRVAERETDLLLLGTGFYQGVSTPFRATVPKTW